MRPALAAALIVVMGSPALAQSTPSPLTGAVAAEAPTQAPADGASLTHSAMKATTFKAGSTAVNLAILSYATGGVTGGVVLSGFMLASSWLWYTANDYLWDTYDPPPEKQSGAQEFDASADAWRNTKKYLTFKPVIGSVKLLSLYVYTGSAAVAGVFGTAAIASNTVVFFVNNMAWDWYDWYSREPATAARLPQG